MTPRAVVIWAIMLIAVMARYGPVDRHQISITNKEGFFKFSVDELPDGRHSYEASYNPDCWLLTAQHESGTLSDKEWQVLNSLQTSASLPKDGGDQLREPAEVWGVMQRGNETIVLRYAEWWNLSDTPVSASFWSMTFKAKASL